MKNIRLYFQKKKKIYVDSVKHMFMCEYRDENDNRTY